MLFQEQKDIMQKKNNYSKDIKLRGMIYLLSNQLGPPMKNRYICYEQTTYSGPWSASLQEGWRQSAICNE